MKIFVCETYEEAFRTASKGKSCQILTFPPLCFSHKALSDDFFSSQIQSGEPYVVLGSPTCLPDRVRIGLAAENFQLEQVCANYLLNGDYVEELMQKRYVASSYWVDHFEEIVTNHWGFNQASARDFFHESVQGITILNELKSPVISEKSKLISSYLDMDVDVLNVGRDMIKKQLDLVLTSAQSKAEQSLLKKEVQNTGYKMAEYLMVFDFISNLNLNMSETQVLESLVDFLTLLTAARYVFVCHKGASGVSWSSTSGEHLDEALLDDFLKGKTRRLLLESKGGFILKHTNDADEVLVLYANHVLFIDKAPEYMDLLTNVMDMIHIGFCRIKDFAQHKQLMEDLSVVNAKLSEVERDDYIRHHIAAIAHELTSPIAVGVTIGSFIQEITRKLKHEYASGQLSKRSLSNFIDEVEETMGTLHDNMDNAKSFIEAFRQVAVDQASDQYREIDLVAYMKSVVKIMGPLLKTNQCQVDFTGCDHLMLYTNPSAVSQVITNLVQNAIIHGQDDICSIRIHVSLNPDQKLVSLRFSDMGPGIESSLINHIFEPFFTTRKGKGGSGLGLAIIKKIIETDLKGTIEYVDDKCCGACFLIVMPYDQASDDNQ